jgi:hypothetical protein
MGFGAGGAVNTVDVKSLVMAGLVPAIHVLLKFSKDVDARDKPGHDEFLGDPVCGLL